MKRREFVEKAGMGAAALVTLATPGRARASARSDAQHNHGPISGPLALIAVVPEPVPAWLAIPGLLVLSVLVLIYASSKVKAMEISYSE